MVQRRILGGYVARRKKEMTLTHEAGQPVGERRDAVLGRPARPWEKKAQATRKMRESGAGLRERKGPGWTASSGNSRAGQNAG